MLYNRDRQIIALSKVQFEVNSLSYNVMNSSTKWQVKCWLYEQLLLITDFWKWKSSVLVY